MTEEPVSGDNVRVKLPKSIQIGGHRIRLKVAPLDDCWGTYNHETKTIILSPLLFDDPKNLYSTLRHEMAEAALFISGVAWSERYEQEPIVRALEEILFPALDRLTAYFQ